MWDLDVLHEENAALRQRVEELERSILRHFQEEHLAGDGPEIDRWKREVARLRKEVPTAAQEVWRAEANRQSARAEAAEAERDAAQARRDEVHHLWQAAEAKLFEAQTDRMKYKAEVERLRDIISPGDAAAYEQGRAASAIPAGRGE